MKVKTAIKKIEKYLGVKVEYVGHRYTFQYEDQVGSFLPNGHAGGMGKEAMEAEACNWHRRRYDDHSDSMSDYFAGSFRDNVTQLLHSMKPPPCKFRAGQLVRGKNTKRAIRHQFADKTGLVTKETGDSCTVQWIGETTTQGYISTRDLELVS